MPSRHIADVTGVQKIDSLFEAGYRHPTPGSMPTCKEAKRMATEDSGVNESTMFAAGVRVNGSERTERVAREYRFKVKKSRV